MSQVASFARRAADISYALAIAIFVAFCGCNHFQIVTAPAPLELYEGTIMYITELFAHGQNPYSAALQPEATYVYTPLYNIVMAPITLALGNSLFVHRSVIALLILASSSLLIFTARRMGAKWLDAAAVGALAYAALIFYATPIVSTNALGVLLYLAAALLPYLQKWSTPSLAASALLGVLAFYAKQYCLLAVPMVAAYLFLNVSKTRAVAYGAAAAALLVTSLAVIQRSSPFFLANTVFAQRTAAAVFPSTDHLARQLMLYGKIYSGLLLLAAITGLAAFLAAAKTAKTLLRALAPRILPLGAPLVSASISYPWFCFAIATTAIVFSLGKNPGNFMSYLFQLMTPFMLLGLSNTRALGGKWRILALPLYLLSFVQAYNILPKDFHVTVESWSRVRQIVCSSRDVLASGLIVLPVIQCGKPVHYGGHTGYIRLGAPPVWRGRATLPWPIGEQIWQRYKRDLENGVRERRFDAVIFVDRGWNADFPPVDPGLIRRYYLQTQQMSLSLSDRYGGGSYNVRIWRPRAGSPGSP